MENLAINNQNKNNVVGFNNNNLYSYIQIFLNSKAANTKRSYSSYIDNFFVYMTDKHIDEITWKDITDRSKFNIATIDKYYSYLQNEATDRKGNSLSNKTVNVYMAAIKSLYRTLVSYGEELGYVISEKIFINTDRLTESDNHWGAMMDNEIWGLIDYAKTESYKGEVKSVYFEFLYVTGIRKTASLGLKWSDIVQKYDFKSNITYWCLDRVKDKGREHTIPIPDKLYDKLLSIKDESYCVFNIGEKALRDTFDNYCKINNINKVARNLSLHSIKHTGVLKVLGANGNDYEEAKQYSHHSKTDTLFNYTNKDEDLIHHPIYNFYNETDTNKILDASEDKLKEAILDCPEYIIKEILKRLENK